MHLRSQKHRRLWRPVALKANGCQIGTCLETRYEPARGFRNETKGIMHITAHSVHATAAAQKRSRVREVKLRSVTQSVASNRAALTTDHFFRSCQLPFAAFQEGNDTAARVR